MWVFHCSSSRGVVSKVHVLLAYRRRRALTDYVERVEQRQLWLRVDLALVHAGVAKLRIFDLERPVGRVFRPINLCVRTNGNEHKFACVILK